MIFERVKPLDQILATAEPTLASHGASAAAAIVLDNASADVLAYVGAPDFYDREALGQNDGVIALRQPGSTLKPFIYALAFISSRFLSRTMTMAVSTRSRTI